MAKAFTLARRCRRGCPRHHPTLRFTQVALDAAFAADCSCWRNADFGELKGGVKPPMASPAEPAMAIRSADCLARDARWPDLAWV
jgi:hypothetical protein